jgi:hypothetical protein
VGGEENVFAEALVVVLRAPTTASVGFDCAGANDADRGFITIDLLSLLLRQATRRVGDCSISAILEALHPLLMLPREESDWLVDWIEARFFFRGRGSSRLFLCLRE